MQFSSTRNTHAAVTFSAALAQGLASDGGLFVPAAWPAPLADRPPVPGNDAPLAALAEPLLRPFLAGDALEPELGAIAREAFDFPAPQFWLDSGQRLGVLELFHGPTAAFKDFGARFLAAALARLRRQAPRPLKILVATSGDTGGAVAAAFHNAPGIEVAVLFPKGLVSPTQEQQLTCWGGNVTSFAVRGRFDDCQRMVKQAFADAALRDRFEVTSANSINLGRLLPQMCYYWAASLRVAQQQGEPASFVVPSGNLGNVTACVWARRLGAPIAAIVLAHNANRTVPDYLSSGTLRPRASVATLSSAMDVGDPSNLERLSALYPDAASLRTAVSAVSVSDEATANRIRLDFERYGRVWCPHTAVAAEAHARLGASVAQRGRWLLVATAHPAKFRETVAPLIGENVPLPENLARLFDRPSRSTEIDPDIESLRREL
ncbi:MAG TPA: threonine synthase [Steroidobacteraceae bacterium]|jgi:threonine synthase